MGWDSRAVSVDDQWRPFVLVAAVLLTGLFVGVVVGLSACNPGGVLTGAKEERYYVAASRLYAQGESVDAMKDYLAALNSRDLPSTILRLADTYESSSDESKRAEARDLRQLGDALRSGPGLLSSLGKVPIPTMVTSSASSAAATSAPVPTPTPSPVPTPSSPPPTPTKVTAAPQAVVTGKGIAKPTGSGGAVLREQPTSQSKQIGSLATGTKVDVLKVVDGEAVDDTERRWYQVKYGNTTGYVYFKIIVQGD